jgi:hypothetical protein
MGIFRISLTQGEVNKETKRVRFHEPLGVIKSETIKSEKEDLLKGRGLGEKKSTIGIQEEFQTERKKNYESYGKHLKR